MNLSETTFILPREPELEATYGTRVRIFTTREELPFRRRNSQATSLKLRTVRDSAFTTLPGNVTDTHKHKGDFKAGMQSTD